MENDYQVKVVTYVGLFGETDGATISNLAISQAAIGGDNEIGTLIGYADINVSGIRVEQQRENPASGSNVAGLVGEL